MTSVDLYWSFDQERVSMIHQVVAAFMLGEGIVFSVIAYAMFRKKTEAVVALAVTILIQALFIFQNVLIANAVGIHVPVAVWLLTPGPGSKSTVS